VHAFVCAPKSGKRHLTQKEYFLFRGAIVFVSKNETVGAAPLP
jgi:hypothetical protein